MNEKLIKKYKSQYNNVELVFNNRFHDRFIIIDKKSIYHCGSSFKDLGKKCFSINKIESNKILNDVLDEIKKQYKLYYNEKVKLKLPGRIRIKMFYMQDRLFNWKII